VAAHRLLRRRHAERSRAWRAAGRFGHFDLALLPINGLCIRPLNGQQVVMNATEADELTAVLRPDARLAPETTVRLTLPGERVSPRAAGPAARAAL
jgi:hypothetical protein